MDIHRCRFVPFRPSAVNAVAFSHPKTRKQNNQARLAVGRANGDIELWNPGSGSWHQETVIRGGKDRSVDGLVWVNEQDQDLGEGNVLPGRSRLFSIGYTTTVTEWDIEKGKPKSHASGQHGDIWCLAAQPPANAEQSQANGTGSDSQHSSKLVAGTIDGELALYALEDDEIRFQRLIVRSPTKKAQMVSMTFQSRKVIIVGCSDSTIRAYDFRGTTLRRMTLGADRGGGSKNIIVWSVKCLSNGNIVSGDSTGQLCIWDGKTYTQTQRIQSHKADILSLAISDDGSSIMTGGMDRRTVLHKQTSGQGKRWTKVSGRKFHDHDVKTMASFESGRVSVVVSGGPDSNLVVVPLKEMGRENHRTLSNLPHQAPLVSARKARFILSWWDREVHLWVLKSTASELQDVATGGGVDHNRKLLKTIVINGDSNISSATITDDGKLLVVSTSNDIKAFRLDHQDPMKPSDIKLSTIAVPNRLAKLGASLVRLSPDGQWLCAVQEGHQVVVAGLSGIGQVAEAAAVPQIKMQILSRFSRKNPKSVQSGGLRHYDRTIVHLAFSPDSRMIATADLAGYIDTWVLGDYGFGIGVGKDGEGADSEPSGSDSEESSDDDSTSSADGIARWTRNPKGRLIPKLPAAPALLSFSDDLPESSASSDDANSGSDYTLLVATASWHILVLNPLRGSLTDWSRRHSKSSLPGPVQDLLDLPKGAIWQGSRVWINGTTFFLMLDLSQSLPQPSSTEDLTGDRQNRKRKRIGKSTGAGGKKHESNLIPHAVTRHSAGEDEDLNMEGMPAAEVDDDSDADSDENKPDGGELAQMRNQQDKTMAGNRKQWWLTHKYRPIFGVVPLSGQGEGMEVAIVERPLWDLDLPDRFFAGEEWET